MADDVKNKRSYERREYADHGVKKIPPELDYEKQINDLKLDNVEMKGLLIGLLKRIEENTGIIRTICDFQIGPAMRSIPISSTGRTDRGYLSDFYAKYDEYGKPTKR
jgi:hypothetical protein